MVPKKELILIASPRTGTNYLCDTLGAFDEILNLFEIFNYNGVFGTERFPEIFTYFNKVLKIDNSDVMERHFVNYVMNNRIRFIEQLNYFAERIGKTVISYKILPEQLASKELDEIINDYSKAFLIIGRSRIDTFISYKKALHTNEWVHKNTKEVMIEVSFDEFMQWSINMDKWYQDILDKLILAKQQFCLMSYETDINVPKGLLIEKLYLIMRGLGFDLSFPQKYPPPMYNRQDAEVGPFKKILNGKELKQKFIDKNLLQRYALRSPLIK